MKKIKLFIFILLIVSFLIVLFYAIFGTSISFLSSKEIKENRKLKEDLINEIKINNIEAIYDKNSNTYLYTVSEKYQNNIYVLNIDLENQFKYKIVDETLNIIKVDYNKPINIVIYNDKYYYETKIQITNLPIVNIKSEDIITKNETKSEFCYINPNNQEKTIKTNSEIHIRGATSTLFPKKSYKVSFVNKNYNKDKELYISNFYYGESLILDAVYRDPSKIRNLLATELWNDISNDFTNINIYSEFVEVFINNEYKGLYVLTEPINRRKLNLSKSTDINTSIVVKSSGWITPKNNLNFELIVNDSYLDYELKYPNDEVLYSISWKKFLEKTSKYYDSFTDSSYEIINETFNIENYIDLIIFNAFINNCDNNIKKNNYFYIKNLNDNNFFIQPWDMEYSFGLNYSSKNELLIEKNMDDYDEIYTEVIHDSSEINNLLINRYCKLRESVLTKQYFENILNNYKEELTKGASLRDSSVWYEYDIEKEIDDIKEWLYNRLDYMDKYMKDLENV